MQSANLNLEDDVSAAPQTVWRTPQGIPCFSPPFSLGALWRRGRRLVARIRRAMG